MAFMIKRIIDLQGILFLMLMTVTSQATNLDCNGKAFHCVNSTHFMICVDLGRGISTTIDDFVIPCPAPTVCRKTNRFECEFPVPFIPSSTIVTTVTIESEITTVSPPPITTMSFEDNFNTVSTTTLSQTQVQQSSLDDSLSVKPIFITTSGLGITKLSTTEPIITDTLITTNVSSVPEVVGGNISDTSSSNLITDEVSVIHDQTTVNPTSANDVSNLNATVTYPTLNDAVTAESKQSKHLINVTITHGLTSNNSITETEVPLNVSPNEGLTIGSESTPAVIENKTDIISLVAVTELSLKEAVTVGGNNIPEQTTILLDNTTATAQIITTSEVPVTISDADTISIISEQTINILVNNTNDTIAINATTEGSLKGTSYSDSMIGFDQTPTKTTTVTTSVNEVVNVSSNLGQNTGLKHMVTESENITETVATSEATEVPVKVSNILSQNAESKQNITRMERITENAIFITTTEVSTKKSMNEGQNFETKETVSMKGNRNKTVTTIGTTEIPVQPSSKFETVTISANEVPVNVSPNLDLNVESQQIVSTSDNLTESVATLATTKTPIKASSNSSQKIGLEQTVTASENISKTVTTSETTEIPVNVSNTLRQHTESKQNITSRIAEAPMKISSIAGHNPKSKQIAPTNGNMNKTVTTIGTNEIPVKPSYSTDPYYGLEQVVTPFEIETVTINANKIPVNVSNLGLNIVSEQIVSTSDSMTETITTIATTEAAVKTSSDSDQNIPLDELVTTSETITETIATNETTEVLAKLLSSEGKKPASNKYVTKIEKTTENLVITPTTQVPVNMSSTEGRNPESQHAISTKENINKIVTTIELPIKASPDSDSNIGLELIGTILENITKTAAINETAKEQVNASTTVKDQSTGHEQNITNIESITESVVIVSITEIPLKLSSIVGQNTESQQIVSTKDKVTTTELLPVKTSYNSDPIIGLEKTLNTSQKITETAQTSDTTELLVMISSTVDQNTDTQLNTTKIEKIVENMNIIPTTEVSIKRSSTEGQNIAFGPIITALEKGPDIITVDTATEVLVAVSTTESINTVSSQTVSQLENTIAIVTNAATDHPITISTTNDSPNRTVTTFENKAEAIILSTATEVPAVTSFIKDLNNGFDIEFTTELAVNKFQDAVNKSTSNTTKPIDTIVVSKISQEYKHPLISDSIGNLKSLKLKDGVAPLISATDNQRISSTESQVSKLDNTNITHENNIKSNLITINDQIKVDTSTGMTDKPSNLELYQTMTTSEQMFNNSVTLSRENVHPKEITNNEVTITSILNNITTPSNVVLILKNEINNLSNESAHQNTINNVTDANSVNNSSQKSILLEELQTVSSNSRIQTGNTTMTASEDKLKFENPTEMRTQKQISLMTERMPISNHSNNLEILRTTQQTFNLSEVNDGLTNAQKRRNNNTNNARNITNKWAQKESVMTITDNVTWNPVLSTDSTSKTETSTSNGLQSVSLLTNTVDNSLNTDITTIHINLEVLDGNFGTVPTAEKTEVLSTTEYSMQSNPTDIKIPSILKSPIISGISAISNENQITHELRQTQPVTEQLLAQIPKVIDSFVTHSIKSSKTDKEYSSKQTNFTATTAEQQGDNKGQNKSLLAPSVAVTQNKTTTSDLIKILMPQIDTETVSSLKSNIMTIDAVSRDKYQTEMQTETPTVITLNAVLNDSSVTNIEVSNVNDKAGRFPTGTMKKRTEVTEQSTVDVHTFPEIPPSTISSSGPLKPVEISLPSHGLTNDPLTTQTSTYISDVSRTHTYSHLTFTKDVKTVNAPTDYPYNSYVFSTNAQPVTETPSPTKIGSLVSHDNYVGKHILPTYVTESYLEHVNNNFGNGLPNIDSVAKAQAQTLTTQTESNTQSSNAAHITSGNVIGMPTGNQIISPASIQNIDKNVWNDLNMGKMLTTEVNFMDQSLLTSPTSAIINQEAIRLRTSKDNTATFEPYTIDFLTYAPVVTTQVPVILNDNEQIATIKEKNVHEEQTGHQVGAISLEQQSNPLQNLLLNSTIAIQRQKPISTVDLHQYFEKNGNDSISTIQNVSETNISTDSGTESANLSSSTKVLTKLSGSEKTINSQLNDDSFTSNFSKQNKQHSTDSTSPRLQTTLSLPVTQAHVTVDTVGQISNLNKKNNGSFLLATDKNIQPPTLSTVSEFRTKFTTSSITLEKTNHTVTSTNSPIASDASSKLTNILTTESTQPMHAELLSNFAELPSYNTKSRSSISGDQTSGIKQIVSPKSETNISFKTATDKDVTEPTNTPTKSDVVTAYDSQINSFSKRETLNPVQLKVDLTNRTNTSPVKSKFGIDDKNKKIMSYVTIPVTQNISRNIDAMDYTKSTMSSINVGAGIEASTTSDVLVDTNIESGKTHSGIVSLITQAPKSNDAKEKKEESEKEETQDEEKPEHSVNVELGSLQSNGPSTLSTEKSTPILKENTVKRDVLTREELIPQVPNKNFNSNNASYPKELISTNISISNSNYRGTNTTVSENKKVTPTHELIINSTPLTNSNNASSDKSQDQNKRIPLAHNMTVISHDQSITFNNMSHIKSTSVGDMQTTGFPAFQSTTQKTALQKFSCKQRKRGRYADEQDCRKFYICPGNKSSHVVEGSCPVNTVFSEINKQCTKNLSHCIRNNQFRCVTEGRFSDFLNDNVYYICVRNNLNHFIRFKLQCQNGYRLNKTSVRCDLNNKSTSTSESKSVSEQSSSAIKQETIERPEKKFKCKREGVFPDPSNCKKYYECIKVDSSYRQKKKKCDSDEIFHKDKKKCVDAESNEC